MLCMLCFVMLCYAMLWYVMLCDAMQCYVILCYGMLCLLLYVSTLETEHLQILAVLVCDVLSNKQPEHVLSISMLSQYWKHSICKF